MENDMEREQVLTELLDLARETGNDDDLCIL